MPAHGAYVHYPFDDLLAIVRAGEPAQPLPGHRRGSRHGAARGAASSSQPAACCRTGCCTSNATPTAASCRRPPIEPQALVAGATHDLPTLAGWWDGNDLELRAKLNLFPQPDLRERQVIERAQDRARLLLALEARRAAAAGGDRQPGVDPEADARRSAARCTSTWRAVRRRSCSCSSRTCSACASRSTCPAPSTSTRTGSASCRCCSNAGLPTTASSNWRACSSANAAAAAWPCRGARRRRRRSFRAPRTACSCIATSPSTTPRRSCPTWPGSG